jgi:hypothetical protein
MSFQSTLRTLIGAKSEAVDVILLVKARRYTKEARIREGSTARSNAWIESPTGKEITTLVQTCSDSFLQRFSPLPLSTCRTAATLAEKQAMN